MGRKIDVDEFLAKYIKLYEGNQDFLKKSKVPEQTKGYIKCMEDTMYLLRRADAKSRVEAEIESHKLRAIMCANAGNTDEAKDEWYLHDCLLLLKSIQDCGDCNNCANHKNCQYAPELGQMVRYNCPFYKKESDPK